MDSKREAILMNEINFQKEVAREHVQGICKSQKQISIVFNINAL